MLEGKSSAERKQFLQTLPQAKFQVEVEVEVQVEVEVEVQVEVQVQVQVLPYVLSNMIVSSLSPFAPSLISRGENL